MGDEPSGPPPYTCHLERGHLLGGGLSILHLLAFPFLRQSTFYIALHCTLPNYKIKKSNKIYSGSKTIPIKALSDQDCTKYTAMFSILKTDYFYLWFLYKSNSCISCFRNDGELKVSKVHLTCYDATL